MKGFLEKKERKELLSELSLERSRKYADRIRVILLLDSGETYTNIAKFLFLDEGTIANYKKKYSEHKLDGLINDDYLGRKSNLTPHQEALLSNYLEKEIHASTASIINYVWKKFKVKYSRGGMTDLLHRIGFSFKKAKAVPGKADKQKQEDFIELYRALSDDSEVFFADATHPEFQPSISYGWIKKGQDFEVKTNSGWRKRVHILGALNITTKDILSLVKSTINSDAVVQLIKNIECWKIENNKKNVYLILDGAAYNKAFKVKEIAEKANIEIIYLPPYSPNLNVIERLWKFMKKKVTNNKYYEEFDDFKKNIKKFFKNISKYKPELETLLTDNFTAIGT